MLTFLFVVPLVTCGYENKVALNACHLGSHIHRLAEAEVANTILNEKKLMRDRSHNKSPFTGFNRSWTWWWASRIQGVVFTNGRQLRHWMAQGCILERLWAALGGLGVLLQIGSGWACSLCRTKTHTQEPLDISVTDLGATWSVEIELQSAY